MAALLLKLLVPTGYMIGSDSGRVTIELCSGVGPQTMGMSMDHDTPGHGKSSDHGKVQMPCAFSGLSAAAMGAADAIQLAALTVFVMAVGLSPATPRRTVRRVYLRPPLRGPPAAH
ncbi:DUF2946 family protein [Sphingomonas sp. TX0543]|uniref:DUF2946 family protein n=1 Tax=unclassified Sphingomonas TaxID=196159 RepID=UPI0020160D1C|nr:DUF2946 family protein [Sphingomonas sp. 3P27F8]